MKCLHYHENQLFIDNVSLDKIAERCGTPTYVYSSNQILANIKAYENGLRPHPHRLFFAVKSNSNLSILKMIAQENWGFEVVSGGEIERVIQAGAPASSIIFTGVGKTVVEILRGLELGIFCFTVESSNELLRIEQLAKKVNKIAPIALRINPDIDSKSHPHISTGKATHKFGMSCDQALTLLNGIKNSSYLKLNGIACHIGSQITDISTYALAIDKMLDFMKQVEQHGLTLSFLNMGGGLGINYTSSDPAPIAEHTEQLVRKLNGHPYTLLLEPGRSIVGNAGVLLSTVEYIKKTSAKNFVILDCAMNDLMRPALYDGWHDLWPVQQHNIENINCDIVGPICETTDVLGSNRDIKVIEGDLVVLLNTGAYGFSMSSHYNSRPRCAEVLVKDNNAYLIRERETYADLFRQELIPDVV